MRSTWGMVADGGSCMRSCVLNTRTVCGTWWGWAVNSNEMEIDLKATGKLIKPRTNFPAGAFCNYRFGAFCKWGSGARIRRLLQLRFRRLLQIGGFGAFCNLPGANRRLLQFSLEKTLKRTSHWLSLAVARVFVHGLASRARFSEIAPL